METSADCVATALKFGPLENKDDLCKRIAQSPKFRQEFNEFKQKLGSTLNKMRQEAVAASARIGMKVKLNAKLLEQNIFQAHFGCAPADLKLPCLSVIGPDNTPLSGVLFWDLPADVPALSIELYSVAERSHSLQLLHPESAVRPGQARDRYTLASNTFTQQSSVKAETVLAGRMAKYTDVQESANRIQTQRAEALAEEEKARLEGVEDETGEQSQSTLQHDSMGLAVAANTKKPKKPSGKTPGVSRTGATAKRKPMAPPVTPNVVGRNLAAPSVAGTLASHGLGGSAVSSVTLAWDAHLEEVRPSDSVSVAGGAPSSALTAPKKLGPGGVAEKSFEHTVQQVLHGWANGREMKTDRGNLTSSVSSSNLAQYMP